MDLDEEPSAYFKESVAVLVLSKYSLPCSLHDVKQLHLC